MDLKGFSVNLKDAIQFPEGGVFSKELIKTPSFHYTVMCLSSGTSIDTHTSSKNGGVLVLEGNGVFLLEDKEIKLEPGVFIFMPANAKHSLKADKNLAILLSLTI